MARHTLKHALRRWHVGRYHRPMDRIPTLVSEFESCELPPSEFHHAQHLTVALWYLTRNSFDDAADKFRVGVKRYLGHHAVDPTKYHETITMFWLHVVDRFLAGREPSYDLEATASALINAWGDSRAIGDHYSKELLASDVARTRFVEPDVRPLTDGRA